MMVPLTEPGNQKKRERESWIYRGDDELNLGHIKLKVLAGYSTLELMTEFQWREQSHTGDK